MGNRFQTKAVALILCCLATVALLQRSRPAGGRESVPGLAAAVARIPGWQLVGVLPLDGKIRSALQLDDYVFSTYSNGREQISLYVGFYRSAAKVGAAHHPLVCFSGQGWELSPVQRERVRLPGGETVSWAIITARRDLESEYIAYWFQAHDQATHSPLRQKIALAREKLLAAREDSAFVRINFPVRDRDPAECRRIAVEFLNAFYPVYLDYVRKEI